MEWNSYPKSHSTGLAPGRKNNSVPTKDRASGGTGICFAFIGLQRGGTGSDMEETQGKFMGECWIGMLGCGHNQRHAEAEIEQLNSISFG